jgi:serine/threonine protein kinase
MNDKQRERLKEALLILERMPVDQRDSWIASRLQDDATIQAEVRSLLTDHVAPSSQAHDQLTPLLQPPPALLVAPSLPEKIGPFQIHGVIGQGSAGIVYRGVQTEPVTRHVAVKVLRSGLAAHQLLSRFEGERHALAKMEHRNIARLIDAGTAKDGQAFIAIELVDGPPITEYVKLHQFSLRKRIELFAQVCRGVQHAHARGVLHRDLKPSNILVAEEDSAPVPKVIDFGLAKLLESDPASPGQTQIGQVLGTLSYMSPEQADPARPIADVRSDVFSLGVLLYELLTDALPLPPARFDGLSIHQIHDLLIRHRALPPSRAPRGSSFSKTPSRAGILSSELDCLVLKAIEPDPEHRYASVADLLSDLDRFLSGHAILARPPKLTYLTRKFIERNKLPVIATSLVFVALLAGLLLATMGFRRAVEERTQAQRSLEESQQVSAYLRDLFMQAHPTRLGPKATLETLLKTASADFLKAPPQSLIVRAEVADSIAGPLYETSDYIGVEALLAPLIEPLEQSAEPRAREILVKLLIRLGYVSSRLGNTLLAEERITRATEVARQTNSPELEFRAQGALAQTKVALGKYDAAIELLHQMIDSEVGKTNQLLRASTLSNLGSAYGRKGDFATGLPFSKQGYDIRVRLAPKDPATLNVGWQLGISHMESSQLNEAVEIFERNYAIAKDAIGENHPDVVAGIVMIGFAKARRGDGPHVIPSMRDAVQRQRANNLPAGQLAQSRAYIAGALLWSGQLPEALAEARDTITELRTQVGSCDLHVVRVLLQIGTIFSAGKAPRESFEFLQDAFDCSQKNPGSKAMGPRIARAMQSSYIRLDDKPNAEKWKAIAIQLEAPSSAKP